MHPGEKIRGSIIKEKGSNGYRRCVASATIFYCVESVTYKQETSSPSTACPKSLWQARQETYREKTIAFHFKNERKR